MFAGFSVVAGIVLVLFVGFVAVEDLLLDPIPADGSIATSLVVVAVALTWSFFTVSLAAIVYYAGRVVRFLRIAVPYVWFRLTSPFEYEYDRREKPRPEEIVSMSFRHMTWSFVAGVAVTLIVGLYAAGWSVSDGTVEAFVGTEAVVEGFAGILAALPFGSGELWELLPGENVSQKLLLNSPVVFFFFFVKNVLTAFENVEILRIQGAERVRHVHSRRVVAISQVMSLAFIVVVLAVFVLDRSGFL